MRTPLLLVLSMILTTVCICLLGVRADVQGKSNLAKQVDEQGTPQITLEEILQNHYDAIGGSQAWKAVKTLKFTGNMYTNDATFKMAAIYKRPNICRVDYQSGFLYFMEAYDGKIAWQMNTGTRSGPQVLEGKRASEMVDTCDFDGLLIDHENKGHKIKYAGTEDIDGRKAYVLEVRSNSGNVDTYYLDTKTYFSFMVKGKTSIQNETVDTTIKIGDYMEIGDIKIPFSYEFIVDENPNSETLQIHTVQLNKEFDDELFTMPRLPKDQR